MRVSARRSELSLYDSAFYTLDRFKLWRILPLVRNKIENGRPFRATKS